MKLKKEYLILTLLIAALALYLFFRDRDLTRYELPEAAKVEGKNVTGIEISGGRGKDFQVVRKGEGWILSPGDYPADEKKVQNILDEIGKFTLTALVSESKNYEPYDLGEDKRIHVRVRAGERDALQFDLGKAVSTYRHTFARLGSDPRVYHVRGNLRPQFDKTVDDLRDRKVLSFNRAEISEIAFITGGKTVTWSRKDLPVKETDMPAREGEEPEKKKETLWVDGTGKTADGAKVDALLGSLFNLECEGYLEGKKKEDFKDPLYVLVLKGPQEHRLSVYPKGGEGEKGCPAVSSGNDYPFMLPDYRVDALKTALEKMTGGNPS